MAKLLVVDDSRLARRGIRHILEQDGHTVIEADNGQKAVELAETHQPDCVLTDLLMPEMSGLEFLQTLNARARNCAVIVVTADVQSSTQEECLKLGAAGVLNKPIRKAELRAAVCAALEGARQGGC